MEKPPIEIQFQNAYRDIEQADLQIKARTKYKCGLVSEQEKQQLGCGDLFFESPDSQNAMLHAKLINLGWGNFGYKAEYFWSVKKGDICIKYVEGDIYVKQITK